MTRRPPARTRQIRTERGTFERKVARRPVVTSGLFRIQGGGFVMPQSEEEFEGRQRGREGRPSAAGPERRDVGGIAGKLITNLHRGEKNMVKIKSLLYVRVSDDGHRFSGRDSVSRSRCCSRGRCHHPRACLCRVILRRRPNFRLRDRNPRHHSQPNYLTTLTAGRATGRLESIMVIFPSLSIPVA